MVQACATIHFHDLQCFQGAPLLTSEILQYFYPSSSMVSAVFSVHPSSNFQFLQCFQCTHPQEFPGFAVICFFKTQGFATSSTSSMVLALQGFSEVFLKHSRFCRVFVSSVQGFAVLQRFSPLERPGFAMFSARSSSISNSCNVFSALSLSFQVLQRSRSVPPQSLQHLQSFGGLFLNHSSFCSVVSAISLYKPSSVLSALILQYNLVLQRFFCSLPQKLPGFTVVKSRTQQESREHQQNRVTTPIVTPQELFRAIECGNFVQSLGK